MKAEKKPKEFFISRVQIKTGASSTNVTTSSSSPKEVIKKLRKFSKTPILPTQDIFEYGRQNR